MAPPFRSFADVGPRVLPAEWAPIESRADGAAYRCTRGQTVILSLEDHAGRRWRHLSIARADRLPSWAELVEARDLFLGRETEAYQKFARRSEWVDIHPFCLHLWAPIGFDLTPDFTRGSGRL